MGANRRYDLEERTLRFAKRVIAFSQSLPRTISNEEIARQLIKAAGSVGSNYIGANESLGKKDFRMRIKTSKKESKESRYWLQLVSCSPTQTNEQRALIDESTELMNIFGAILRNAE